MSARSLLKSVIRSGIKHLDPEYVLWNISYGLHSNIPLCCVMYHTFFHAPYCGHFYLKFPLLFAPKDRIGYIRCPKCRILGVQIEIHECTAECKPKKIINPERNLKRYNLDRTKE